MGSQTLEILRQGVWASLTGGWFYDPHQGVFCNVVHLYLWLFLLCSPFVAYLYFPPTVLTWSLYCIFTSITILLVKIINMALHRLYDRAQSMSEANLKNQFFKVTKESEPPDYENGIEMKVMKTDATRDSVDQRLNEASEENSMMSMENVNSIIDLKVDVHRKNSSESLNLIFYAPSISGNSQQDQHSIAGSTGGATRSIRSSAAGGEGGSILATTGATGSLVEAMSEKKKRHPNERSASINVPPSAVSSQIGRKSSSDDFKRRQHRRRLERQSSLHACIETNYGATKRTTSSSAAPAATASSAHDTFTPRNETFLHSQASKSLAFAVSEPVKTEGDDGTKKSSLGALQSSTSNTLQRSSTSTTVDGGALAAGDTSSISTFSSSKRLQRHRSSETHEERLKQQNRGLFLTAMQFERQGHAVSVESGGHGGLATNTGDLGGTGRDNDSMSSVAADRDQRRQRSRALQSWILGSSSDVFTEDDNCSKSEFNIEHLDDRTIQNINNATWLLKQEQHLNYLQHLHYQCHHQHHHHRHYHPQHQHMSNLLPSHLHCHQNPAAAASHRQVFAAVRKDSNSTMSALQLAVVGAGHPAPLSSGHTRHGAIKKRRHSNATTTTGSFKGGGSGGGALTPSLSRGDDSKANDQHQPTVRRIKSAALEFACLPTSVSNLPAHPNSVEAISGRHEIKNPPSALLPPPSKSLVRNPHLNLCPKLGGSFGGSTVSGGSGSSLNFGASASGDSTSALIEPSSSSYPMIVEQADEKTSQENTDGHSTGPVAAVSSGESEGGGEMLADCDEFKDFDDDLEQIINELEDLRAAYEQPQPILGEEDQAKTNNEDTEHDETHQERPKDDEKDEEESSPPAPLCHRVHSSDSETENNGSRSPLLSREKGKAWDAETSNAQSTDQAADQELRMEIEAIQKLKHASPLERSASGHPVSQRYEMRPQFVAKNEGDSGCPSSDCEQVSASSKDMLLAGIDSDAKAGKDRAEKISEKRVGKVKDVDLEEGNRDIFVLGEEKEDDYASIMTLVATPSSSGLSKNLGAIPKVVKYREVDETRKRKDDIGATAVPTAQGGGNCSQLYKRRSGSRRRAHHRSINDSSSATNAVGGSAATTTDRSLMAPNASSLSKGPSRTSSTGSLNVSADFTPDLVEIHRMLWVMHGGPVDAKGRPITGYAPDGLPILADPYMPLQSPTHYHFYQDAYHAASNCPAAQDEGVFTPDHFLRPTTKPFYDHVIPNASELPQCLAESGRRANRSGPGPGGIVLASTNLISRSSINPAQFSLQGLINVMNEESANLRPQTRSGVGNVDGGGPAATAILNLDGHHIENYCDFWQPACLLSAADQPVVSKTFYKYHLKCFSFEHEFKISMDRLELLALFDRDLHWGHIALAVGLSASVSYLGATILQIGYYKDLFAFLFCAVIAGSQYSLVKSVQPDAASPIHGFNKTVAYSRAIYFTMAAGLLLMLERMRSDYEKTPPSNLEFFGVNYSPADVTEATLQGLYLLLLGFPLIFSLGLLPQINTFLMYSLEQIDMHVFGGNAVGSLLGSFLCVIRSLLAVALLYGPLYAALAEGRGTQYILFSIFCGILVALGYHLSRSASDFSHLWALIKTCIVSSYRDDDDDDDDDEADDANLSGSSVSHRRISRRSSKRPEFPGQESHENIEMSSLDPSGGEPTKNVKASKGSSSSPAISNDQTLTKTTTAPSSKRALAGSSGSCSSVVVVMMAGDGGAGDMSDKGANDGDGATGKTTDDEALREGHDENCGGDNEENLQNGHEKPAGVKSSETLHADDDENGNIDAEKISNSSTTNPGDLSTLTVGGVGGHDVPEPIRPDTPDPLPKKLQSTVNLRLQNDLVVSTILGVVVLSLHSSTVLTVLQPDINIVLYALTGALGLLLHYIIPQMRKHMPWLCFARPILRPKEFGQYEVANPCKVMWFEIVYIYLGLLEKNVLLPLVVISALTADTETIVEKYGMAWGTLIVIVCAMKFIRNSYSDPANQYLIILFTVLVFRVDFAMASETFLIDYFFVSLVFRKCCDFLLKLQFVVTYIAPWQITWGSAFHAFAQPFSVPHSAMLFLQAAVSSALSTPLNPFLGSAIFLTSYARPIKFWERDYNTRRIDHSNTRLSSQLERDLGADDNNLNSIFYEHLTRSLQHSLCGDLMMGRWGNVNQGDCFVLASDYLNCLVHIVELGNGLCTFQMRGLEFRGTYCQQREVEAITEDVEDNDGCCCCDPGHLPRLLSANAMFSTRWLAWQVVAAQYVLEGYSISDNLASATLQVFEYRKVLITYYIKSIIYYVLKNPKVDQWLASGPIQEALHHTLSRQFVDLDPIFNHNVDEDFDFRALGITRNSFCYVYLSWINYCYDKRKENQTPANNGSMPSGGVPATAATASASASTPQAAASPSVAYVATPTEALNAVAAVAAVAASTANNNNNNNNVYNDSKSTPNLSSSVGGSSRPKSQSQQQLRSRPPLKSATMSGSASVSATNHSSDQIAASSSHSFAHMSRQTSESAPGLSGITAYSSFNTSMTCSTVTVPPLGPTRSLKLSVPSPAEKHLRKDDSPTTAVPNVEGPIGDSAEPLRGGGGGLGGDRFTRPAIRLKVPTVAKDSAIVSLCLALGLLARRSLATASHSSLTGVEFFLHGLHALFKGDFRITSPRDEWVFADMDLLHAVVAPAVKMALKLQQDHISNPDEFLDPSALYEAIDSCSKDLVISHEADPVWRSAVLRGAPNLLALRHVMEDGSDEYRIIRLTKRFLSFRVIKLNRECVRGLWAGQQQELIYLRNRNPERGSIQNAKQALRNIINSSCDQPIGYPIYVSPLTTSYADTNDQLRDVIGGAITLEAIRSNVLDWWHRIRERCRQGCSSGSAMESSHLAVGTGATETTGGEVAPIYISAPIYNTLTVGNLFGFRSTNVSSFGSGLNAQFASDRLGGPRRSGLAVMAVKPTSSTLLAGFLNLEREEALRNEARGGGGGGAGGLRKSQTQGSSSARSSSERERRATLPIASSTSMSAANVASGGGAGASTSGIESKESPATGGATCGMEGGLQVEPVIAEHQQSSSSPRYAKISFSSGSLSIGNIITTPGEYPRKTKGPIFLSATAAAMRSEQQSSTGSNESRIRKPRIDLYKKVIIVDDTEIYDCLDLGRRIDVVWPSEDMRLNGGQQSWQDWIPRAGMVGYVVHIWIPNHPDERLRSHVNRIVYLIKIGERYVPVGEYGVREYKQIMGSSEEASEAELRYTMEQQKSKYERDSLTPILGSSAESPTSHLAEAGIGGSAGAVAAGMKLDIRAVSSSSSEDDISRGACGGAEDRSSQENPHSPERIFLKLRKAFTVNDEDVEEPTAEEQETELRTGHVSLAEAAEDYCDEMKAKEVTSEVLTTDSEVAENEGVDVENVEEEELDAVFSDDDQTNVEGLPGAPRGNADDDAVDEVDEEETMERNNEDKDEDEVSLVAAIEHDDVEPTNNKSVDIDDDDNDDDKDNDDTNKINIERDSSEV